jgi:hypothetical protein
VLRRYWYQLVGFMQMQSLEIIHHQEDSRRQEELIRGIADAQRSQNERLQMIDSKFNGIAFGSE